MQEVVVKSRDRAASNHTFYEASAMKLTETQGEAYKLGANSILEMAAVVG